MTRKLTEKEIQILAGNGCIAEEWDSVSVAEKGFLAERVINARFSGRVLLGKNDGEAEFKDNRRVAGIVGAHLIDSEIGDNVLIENIGDCIQNFRIENGASVVNVAGLYCDLETAFGRGIGAI